MRRGSQIAAALVVLTVLAIAAWLTYRVRPDRTEPVEAAPKSTSRLEWDIHDATDEALPAGSYMLFFQESERCNGATVIKQGGTDWRLGIAWYDKETKQLTDIIKRQELIELLSRHVVVDPHGLTGARYAMEDDSVMEMYVGDALSSGENVWLQLDPDSCGVRSGWLVHRRIFGGEATRQKISW